jgi:hypothetical protein
MSVLGVRIGKTAGFRDGDEGEFLAVSLENLDEPS